MKNDDLCRVPKCRLPGNLVYFHLPVCIRHWVQHCSDPTEWTGSPFDLRKLKPWRNVPTDEGEYDPLATTDL